MKTLRFYKILIAILVLLNLTTVYFLWSSAGHHGPPGKNDLVDLIHAEGKTKTTILGLQERHFADKHALIERSRNLHEQLFNSFSDSSKDSTDVKQIIDNIVENQREIEQMTFDYFKEINQLCTPEQQKKLQELIHEVLNRAGGPPPPPKK